MMEGYNDNAPHGGGHGGHGGHEKKDAHGGGHEKKGGHEGLKKKHDDHGKSGENNSELTKASYIEGGKFALKIANFISEKWLHRNFKPKCQALEDELAAEVPYYMDLPESEKEELRQEKLDEKIKDDHHFQHLQEEKSGLRKQRFDQILGMDRDAFLNGGRNGFEIPGCPRDDDRYEDFYQEVVDVLGAKGISFPVSPITDRERVEARKAIMTGILKRKIVGKNSWDKLSNDKKEENIRNSPGSNDAEKQRNAKRAYDKITREEAWNKKTEYEKEKMIKESGNKELAKALNKLLDEEDNHGYRHIEEEEAKLRKNKLFEMKGTERYEWDSNLFAGKDRHGHDRKWYEVKKWFGIGANKLRDALFLKD